VLDRLLDDLRRLGHVRRTPTGATPSVSPEAAALLDLLADGSTLKEASEELFLSRRTADRRLASAREQLGVATTAEALVAWAQRRTGRDGSQ
jgi:DNA-binding NarL/FixJ family response regulator